VWREGTAAATASANVVETVMKIHLTTTHVTLCHPLFGGEDLPRTGKAGRGHALCAFCNTTHHNSKHCPEKKAARGVDISALLQPTDSEPVHTDSDGVETLQIQRIPFWLLKAITYVYIYICVCIYVCIYMYI